jgi:hypothetical protein
MTMMIKLQSKLVPMAMMTRIQSLFLLATILKTSYQIFKRMKLSRLMKQTMYSTSSTPLWKMTIVLKKEAQTTKAIFILSGQSLKVKPPAIA